MQIINIKSLFCQEQEILIKMADGLPINFDVPSEPIFANYDWQDYISKVGYISFYPACYTDSAGSTYKLSLTTDIGQPYRVSFAVGASPWEQDFDYEFGVPMTIKGNAKINFTDYTQAAGSDMTLTITFYKVVGIVETSIGTVTGPTRTNLNGYMGENIEVDLTETNFNIGEKLRVTINAANTGANTADFFLDPAGATAFAELTTARALTSQFKIQVPFRLFP